MKTQLLKLIKDQWYIQRTEIGVIRLTKKDFSLHYNVYDNTTSDWYDFLGKHIFTSYKPIDKFKNTRIARRNKKMYLKLKA